MEQSGKHELEARLALMAGRKYCYIVNRGASALYMIYKIMKDLAINSNRSGNKIILPATMCHSPANVALYAGLEIIFCDVNEDDYTIDTNCLQGILENNQGILGVLSVGIFGHSPDMPRISALCRQYNVWLIDDACQSIGGYHGDIPLGGWGEVGIYSFGYSKIVDIGWGGAILTNDEFIYNNCKRLYGELAPPHENIHNLRAMYAKTYYTVEKLEFDFPQLSRLFWSFPEIFKYLYVYNELPPANKLSELSEALDGLDKNIIGRYRNWDIYHTTLIRNSDIKMPVLRKGSVPWRFTFRIGNNKRANVVNELRQNNLHVSTWYPSLYPRFKTESNSSSGNCGVSQVLSKEVVNLWVAPDEISYEQVMDICDRINKLI